MKNTKKIDNNKKVNDNKKWYILNTRPGFEKKIVCDLLKAIKIFNLSSFFFDSDIIVAVQKEQIIDRKTKTLTNKFREKNLYPGYIFIRTIMNNDIWYMIKNIQGVVGIVGSNKKAPPVPISDEDMEPILKRIGRLENYMYLRYNIGDLVKIINGPFSGSEGKITFIDKESGNCGIETTFFGKAIPTEINFMNIEKKYDK